MMTPEQFMLWMNGACAAIGAAPPDQEQWDLLRQKLGEVISRQAARNLMEMPKQFLGGFPPRDPAGPQYYPPRPAPLDGTSIDWTGGGLKITCGEKP